MRLRHLPVLLALALLLSAAPSFAQTECVVTTAPADVSIGRSRLSFVSASHTAKSATGTEIITDYLGEVKQAGQATNVTSFTIPKASMTLVTTGPANCYQLLLPGMTGLLPANLYTVTVTARGPGGNTVAAAASNPFSVVGAPPGVTNTAVVP